MAKQMSVVALCNLYEGGANYSKGQVLQIDESRFPALQGVVVEATEKDLGKTALRERAISDKDIENRSLKSKK